MDDSKPEPIKSLVFHRIRKEMSAREIMATIPSNVFERVIAYYNYDKVKIAEYLNISISSLYKLEKKFYISISGRKRSIDNAKHRMHMHLAPKSETQAVGKDYELLDRIDKVLANIIKTPSLDTNISVNDLVQNYKIYASAIEELKSIDLFLNQISGNIDERIKSVEADMYFKKD